MLSFLEFVHNEFKLTVLRIVFKKPKDKVYLISEFQINLETRTSISVNGKTHVFYFNKNPGKQYLQYIYSKKKNICVSV